MVLWITVFAFALLLGLVIGRLTASRVDPGLAERAYRSEAALEIADRHAENLRVDLRISQQQAGESRELAAAQSAQLAEARTQLDQERQAMRTATAQLKDTFQALAADALKDANDQFLAMAQGGLKSLVERADGSLEHRQQAVADLVTPLREALTQLGTEQQRLAETRLRETATFSAEIQGLRLQNDQLSTETAKLVNALRTPHVRGRWGEMQLKRTAEIAGMSPHCDFAEQASVQTPEGLRRPDMVVHLPGGREVVVDSKVPLIHYLEAIEATSEADREQALQRHTQLVRSHVEKLSEKRYWAQFDSAEFVVLFIPNDSFLAAAAERDARLLEDASEARVVLATPTTFIALLRVIAVGWREERLAENAERIAALGRELHDRLVVFAEHVNEIGENLGKTVRAYNSSVASLESRALSAARRFRDLEAAGEKEISQLQVVEEVPRQLN
jgi:DNA recombination protein RmuC